MATGTGGDRLREMSFKRSDCAIACALDVVGDKWTLLIVRDLFLGRSRYGEFLAAGEGIPTNVLARRLRRLEAAGLVERRLAPRPRSRYAYRLTWSGRRLGPVLAALLKWSRSMSSDAAGRDPRAAGPVDSLFRAGSWLGPFGETTLARLRTAYGTRG